MQANPHFNSPAPAGQSSLYFLQGKGAKVPVRLQVFKHGGGIYLTFSGEGVHVPLVASAETIAAELRQALAQIEAAIATNDQGHISRQPAPAPARQPEIRDLTGDPRNDFPLFVRRFARLSPDVVAAVAQLYKSQGHKVPGVDAILQAYDDLDAVDSIRAQLINAQGELLYGSRNKIAKKLGIRDAGNYRQRIDTLIWLLKSTVSAVLEDSDPAVRTFSPESVVSNSGRQWQKAVNG